MEAAVIDRYGGSKADATGLEDIDARVSSDWWCGRDASVALLVCGVVVCLWYAVTASSAALLFFKIGRFSLALLVL